MKILCVGRMCNFIYSVESQENQSREERKYLNCEWIWIKINVRFLVFFFLILCLLLYVDYDLLLLLLWFIGLALRKLIQFLICLLREHTCWFCFFSHSFTVRNPWIKWQFDSWSCFVILHCCNCKDESE